MESKRIVICKYCASRSLVVLILGVICAACGWINFFAAIFFAVKFGDNGEITDILNGVAFMGVMLGGLASIMAVVGIVFWCRVLRSLAVFVAGFMVLILSFVAFLHPLILRAITT